MGCDKKKFRKQILSLNFRFTSLRFSLRTQYLQKNQVLGLLLMAGSVAAPLYADPIYEGSAAASSQHKARLEGAAALEHVCAITARQDEDRSETRILSPLSKPSLVIFTANWCSYCQQLDSKYLSSAAFQTLAEAVTVCVIEMSPARNSGKQVDGLKERFDISSVPTLTLFNTNGKELMRWNFPDTEAEAFTKEILQLIPKV